MAFAHKKLVEKARGYLKELIPEAESLHFEEFLQVSQLDSPANAAIVVFS